MPLTSLLLIIFIGPEWPNFLLEKDLVKAVTVMTNGHIIKSETV